MAATEAPAAALSNQLLFIKIQDQTSHMAHGDGCQWCQAISMVPRYDRYCTYCTIPTVLQGRRGWL